MDTRLPNQNHSPYGKKMPNGAWKNDLEEAKRIKLRDDIKKFASEGTAECIRNLQNYEFTSQLESDSSLTRFENALLHLKADVVILGGDYRTASGEPVKPIFKEMLEELKSKHDPSNMTAEQNWLLSKLLSFLEAGDFVLERYKHLAAENTRDSQRVSQLTKQSAKLLKHLFTQNATISQIIELFPPNNLTICGIALAQMSVPNKDLVASITAERDYLRLQTTFEATVIETLKTVIGLMESVASKNDGDVLAELLEHVPSLMIKEEDNFKNEMVAQLIKSNADTEALILKKIDLNSRYARYKTGGVSQLLMYLISWFGVQQGEKSLHTVLRKYCGDSIATKLCSEAHLHTPNAPNITLSDLELLPESTTLFDLLRRGRGGEPSEMPELNVMIECIISDGENPRKTATVPTTQLQTLLERNHDLAADNAKLRQELVDQGTAAGNGQIMEEHFRHFCLPSWKMLEEMGRLFPGSGEQFKKAESGYHLWQMIAERVKISMGSTTKAESKARSSISEKTGEIETYKKRATVMKEKMIDLKKEMDKLRDENKALKTQTHDETSCASTKKLAAAKRQMIDKECEITTASQAAHGREQDLKKSIAELTAQLEVKQKELERAKKEPNIVREEFFQKVQRGYDTARALKENLEEERAAHEMTKLDLVEVVKKSEGWERKNGKLRDAVKRHTEEYAKIKDVRDRLRLENGELKNVIDVLHIKINSMKQSLAEQPLPSDASVAVMKPEVRVQRFHVNETAGYLPLYTQHQTSLQELARLQAENLEQRHRLAEMESLQNATFNTAEKERMKLQRTSQTRQMEFEGRIAILESAQKSLTDELEKEKLKSKRLEDRLAPMIVKLIGAGIDF